MGKVIVVEVEIEYDEAEMKEEEVVATVRQAMDDKLDPASISRPMCPGLALVDVFCTLAPAHPPVAGFSLAQVMSRSNS